MKWTNLAMNFFAAHWKWNETHFLAEAGTHRGSCRRVRDVPEYLDLVEEELAIHWDERSKLAREWRDFNLIDDQRLDLGLMNSRAADIADLCRGMRDEYKQRSESECTTAAAAAKRKEADRRVELEKMDGCAWFVERTKAQHKLHRRLTCIIYEIHNDAAMLRVDVQLMASIVEKMRTTHDIESTALKSKIADMKEEHEKEKREMWTFMRSLQNQINNKI